MEKEMRARTEHSLRLLCVRCCRFISTFRSRVERRKGNLPPSCGPESKQSIHLSMPTIHAKCCGGLCSFIDLHTLPRPRHGFLSLYLPLPEPKTHAPAHFHSAARASCCGQHSPNFYGLAFWWSRLHSQPEGPHCRHVQTCAHLKSCQHVGCNTWASTRGLLRLAPFRGTRVHATGTLFVF